MKGCGYGFNHFYAGCLCVYPDYVWVVVDCLDTCFVECWVVSAEIMSFVVPKADEANQF